MVYYFGLAGWGSLGLLTPLVSNIPRPIVKDGVRSRPCWLLVEIFIRQMRRAAKFSNIWVFICDGRATGLNSRDEIAHVGEVVRIREVASERARKMTRKREGE